MIINKINDNGSGPWGSGGGNNPWGKKPNSNGTPPDVDQMLKEGKEKFKKMMPTGVGGGKGITILLFILLVWPTDTMIINWYVIFIKYYFLINIHKVFSPLKSSYPH